MLCFSLPPLLCCTNANFPTVGLIFISFSVSIYFIVTDKMCVHHVKNFFLLNFVYSSHYSCILLFYLSICICRHTFVPVTHTL